MREQGSEDSIVKTTGDRVSSGRAGRFARLAACALALAALVAHAAPAPGTIIQNQASASGMVGAIAVSGTSNIVSLTVSAPVVPPPTSAMLTANEFAQAFPGGVVYLPHVLTNTSAAADSFTITVTDLNQSFSFASIAVFPDANGDGKPDSAVPLANPVALAAGQSFRFVVRLTVPNSAPVRTNGAARVSVVGAGAGVIAPNTDTVGVLDQATPDCAHVTKFLSSESGPSPAGPITVALAYTPCDTARAMLRITDALPVGMKYLAGSGRWSGTGAAALSDAIVGGDREGTGSTQIAYDYDATAPGAVSATIFNIPAGGSGQVTFQVGIDAGLAIGTVVPNTAEYVFYDSSGNYGGRQFTETVSYRVTGTVSLELTGQRLPTADPGSTASFRNVLTNRGSVTGTFDITLDASTFPAGTSFALYKGDGTTPLADTDGDGTPDTGPVAPGASYEIVVRAAIPATAPPGAYKVTKTARPAGSPMVSASADDAVDTIASKCALVLEPDHQAHIGRGQHVTYTHFLTNRGNCAETAQALVGYLVDSHADAGWTSAAYIDNPVAGGASIPGVVDSTDAPVTRGWSITVAPGESKRVLIDVSAPQTKAAQAKSIVDSDVTTVSVSSSGSGVLTINDTTSLDDQDIPPQTDNVIRNFTDASYASATPWGVVGGNLWLRADAAACNTDPAVVDSRIVVITGPGGEREEVTAVETGANTGIFVVPAFAVRAPPVVAGDHVLEGQAGDVFDIAVQGCGQTIETVVTLMAPTSVVFDSHDNSPVPGAVVTLVNASGAQCSATPAAVSGNPSTSGADGRFAFPPVPAGSYCLSVQAPNGYHFPSQVPWTLLPPGHNLDVTGLTSGGSYGNPFVVAAGGLVVVDIPVDGVPQSGLFVQKDASKTEAEVGDFVDYTVRVSNGTGNALNRASVVLTDNLPAGFAYMPGTARRDGKRIDDPAGGQGPHLAFSLGTLDSGAQTTITYRVRVGPGSMQGDGVNRAQASYTANATSTVSNVAMAKVQVSGGVFSDQGFILGRIFMDCNANGLQDKGEMGVPGVRILLEDGTYVITDGGGKFSFYGIDNRTHVVKVDRTTLPADSRLEAISARNLGDGGSRIVDLKAGEMHRADFAIDGCAESVLSEVKARVHNAAKGDELTALAGTQLATQATVITDVKALPASGVVASPASGPLPGAPAAAGPTGAGAGFAALAPAATPAFPSPAPGLVAAPAKATHALEPLEKLVPTLDGKLGFIGIADGDTLPVAQATVRVKGTAGSALHLAVNGEEVSEKHVGKRSTLAEKQVQAWEYIGVELKPGENALTVSQVDQFGNARGSVTIHVIAPGELAKVAIELPAAGAVADGKTPAKVVVKLTDAHGVPVTSRTAVTLEATLGKWQVEDLDPKQPGVQVFVEGGRGEFTLAPPLEPGESHLVATSGTFRAEARLDFLPELRNLVATGVIEGIVNMRNIDTRALTPARASDGFEQELSHLSRDWNDGRTEAGARAAFYLKGKIKGEYLLTAAYDSDKDTQERLFRDIQPDEFYPVYGDSGVRGYDAQSTSKLYVRVDHNRSYLLWGDFTTTSTAEVRKLSNYTRSLTGVKEHYENSRVSVNAFASRDTTRQVIEELRANGTSGPFQLSTQGALINSETVEIITRDRNQPALVLSTVPQSRFSDYEIEELTGRILFKAPVPSVDGSLNPVFVRVTYEVDQGGEQFWVVGIDGQVKVTDRVEVGGVYVKDKNPLAPFTLEGANATVKVGDGTYLISEIAHTENGVDDVKGNAERIEVKHDSAKLKAQAYVARTDADFNNPGAYLSQGRGEAGGHFDYKLSPSTTIKGEALRTEDVTSGSVLDGASVTVQHQLHAGLTLEVGLRHAAQKGATSPVPAVEGQPTPESVPDDVTTAIARMTGPVPGVKGATMYGEAEVDVKETDRKVLAVGGEYQLPDKSRIYARHEFISSISGPYALNQADRQNTTAVGVDTEYMKDGHLFSEYRIRDAMAGGDAEAALGLKNLWSIAPGVRLGTSLEQVHALSGVSQAENTALALALEYTGSKAWKGSTRLELQKSATQETLLSTIGLAARVKDDLTALARNSYNLTRDRADSGEHVIERMQAGLAWRDNETNKWNVLARVEDRLETDTTQPGIALKTATQLVSINADWQLSRPFLVTGRYAAKWSTDNSNGLATRDRAQVVGGRATWEFAPRWDVGLVASVLMGADASSRQYGIGVEMGYLVATNLWVSAGYNVSGYRDADLEGADYTAKGPYVRVRYKFDESLLQGAASADNKTMNSKAGEGKAP